MLTKAPEGSCYVLVFLEGQLCYLVPCLIERKQHRSRNLNTVMGWIMSPLKYKCWSPTPCYLRKWLCLETGSLKRWLNWNEVVRARRRRWGDEDTAVQREVHVKVHGVEGSHLQTKEKGLRRNLPWSIPWSETSSLQNCKEINICCLSHPAYGTQLQQPCQTNKNT